MSEQLRITYDSLDIDGLKEEFEVYRKDVKSALEAAVKDTAAIINEDMSDKMAHVSGLSARIVRGRIYLRYAYKRHAAQIWVGLNPFPLKAFRPRQTKNGVTAKGRQYKGAFIAKSIGGNVFRRSGRRRLPIEKLSYDIKEQGEGVFEAVSNTVEEVFYKVLKVKLNGIKSKVKRKDIR